MSNNRIEKFEGLIAWQKAGQLTKHICTVTKSWDFSKDYGLKEQIRKASVSIMSTLAEGFERGGRSEFHHFLVIAKGLCAELRSHLYGALDAGYIDADQFQSLYSLGLETSRVVGGLRAAVYKQKAKKR